MPADHEVRQISIEAIDTAGRRRPVNEAGVAALMADIKARGLRVPIEVAKVKESGRFRLVSGLHRLTAFRDLGRETIPAFVVSGNLLELRRDELLENLTRNELSKLERAQFLAELKRVHLEMHPEAGRGGDRRSEEFQIANMADRSWAATAIARTGWTLRTLERAVAIGERLDESVADELRGTAIEDNQKELEALCRFGPTVQRRVAGLIAAGKARSVAAAHRVLSNVAAPEAEDPDDKALKRLLDAWNRSPKKVQGAFLREIGAAMTESEAA